MEEKIRGLVFQLAGVLNIDDDWCKENESTEIKINLQVAIKHFGK